MSFLMTKVGLNVLFSVKTRVLLLPYVSVQCNKPTQRQIARSNSRQLSHLARALANFRLIFFTIIKDAVPILRINLYRISL
jgi:hypothetical protein